MATLNPDFVAEMSAFGSDFHYKGVHYKTLWTVVQGPVKRRRNYKQDWILVDMWMADVPQYDESVDVGSEPWIAALQETAFDALFDNRIRIGELSAFQFESGYTPEKPWDYIESDLYFELGMMEYDPEWDEEDEVPMQARPKFHRRLIETLKAYEYYREKKLRESIFFYHWARDCDLCESEGAEVFRNWYEAAEWIHGFGESAEGPQSLHQMTYEQWRVFVPEQMRDRALEQFEEYGYGS